jgi:GntR family transcriptional regulator
MDPLLLLTASPSSGVPIYRQLIDQLCALIASGRLEPGAFLPSVRQVAQHLQVNPMTVSKAYSLLEREGVLARDRGQGMRVLGPATRKGVRERREELHALLKDVVVKAHQLDFDADEVIGMLKPMLIKSEKKSLQEDK